VAFLQQREAEQEERRTLDYLTAQRADLCRQKNAAGQYLRTETGGFVPTDYGRAYSAYEQRLFDIGVTDHRERDALAHEYAETQMKAALGGSPKKPAPGATKSPHSTGGRTPTGTVKPAGSLSDMLRAVNKDVPDDVVELSIS
jgi:hypothetical protein